MAGWTNNNPTYYINPAYITFVENSGYGANLIQVSASSSCYISVFIPGVIEYSDADKNYRRWKVTAYNNKFPDNGKFYIYIRLEKNGTSALVVYDKVLRGVHGGEIIEKEDEEGNVVKEEGEYDESHPYYHIHIGEAGATDGTSIRKIAYDTGYLTSDMSQNDKGGLSDMWELDKYSTPWLIRAKQWLSSFSVKGFITLVGGLIFKNQENEEKRIVDIKRSTDDDVPVSDETVPTTAYVRSISDDRYLKKYEEDETNYRIKFYDGIEAGHYVKGMIGGSGTRFDGQGYGEMNGLTLREFLEVPELRFNRIDVVSGELWNSIAFGLIESVDTEKRICRIKLEGRERCGIQIHDICRGIFSDFGDGSQWEGVDECGFQHLYGFKTSYFTPTRIIDNEEGRFSFFYNIKEGTTVHPCASMKFAVYGNFMEPTRQASAYSTRTYKRYLNKVNTWVIDPEKHIYAQFGNLDGLTVGGYEMKGYGSFQSNVYITGGVFQFTPQQKEELKGEDAYSVVLSDYEGVVVINDEGEIVGGESGLVNVVTGGQNVVSDGQNVITSVYRLTTQVQAMRGKTMLHHALSVEKDGYVVGLKAIGCTAIVLNGVVVVTSVTDPKNCEVEIAVNCEGNAVFTKVYRVATITDGKNPVIADFDNEMDSVACDSEGKVLFGLPVSTRVSVWAGTKQLDITRMEVVAPEGVTVSKEIVAVQGNGEDDEEGSDNADYGVLTVTEITKEAARTLPVEITVYAAYGGVVYHRTLTFTVNKVIAGDNAVIYKLQPSTDSVKMDKENNLSHTSVSCEVIGFDGKKVVDIAEIGEGLSMEYSVNGSGFKPYGYKSEIPVSKDDKSVKFRLFQEGVMIDSETVWIIKDGNSIEGVSEYYLATSYGYDAEKEVTREDGPWGEWQKNSIPKLSQEKRYLWNYEVIRYSGSEPTVTDPTIIAWWTKDGRGVKDVVEWYMVNNDRETIPAYGDSRWVSVTPPKMDKDHRYLWNYEQVVWTEGDDTRTDPAIIGVFGEDGESALSLVASTDTIARNSFGSYQPSSVRVRALRAGKEERVYFTVWGIYMDAVSQEKQFLVQGSTHASFVDFNPAAYFTRNFIRLEVYAYSSAIDTYADPSYVERKTINYIGDGSSGPMPRNRGKYSPLGKYFYNETFRDFMWNEDGKVYMRDGLGAGYSENKVMTDDDTNTAMQGGVTDIPPSNATYWTEVPRTALTAIDTALVENANIAGFMFKGGRMVAQNNPANTTPLPDSKLILDGTTGYFKCVDADVDGNIKVGSLRLKTKTGGGSLSGYSLGLGGNSFQLPALSAGENMELKLLFPSGEGATKADELAISVGLTNAKILVYDETEQAAYYKDSHILNSNTLYTVFGYCDSSGFTSWIIGGSFGSGNTMSVAVDTALSPSSPRPIANKAVYSKTKELEEQIEDRIQVATSLSEAINGTSGVLYIIG